MNDTTSPTEATFEQRIQAWIDAFDYTETIAGGHLAADYAAGGQPIDGRIGADGDVYALRVADLRAVLKQLAAVERDHAQTIAERDRAEAAADRLAYAIAPVEVIGEHSSGNDPWANALDVLAEQEAPHAKTWTAPDGTVLELSRQIFDRDGEAWALVTGPALTVGMVDGDASDRTLPELFARYGPLTNEGEEL